MTAPGAGSRALVVAVLAFLLTACATVPTSGPINAGPVVDSGESSQFIRVIAAPPSVGASPVEIVRGFLEANASQQDDWDIARRYLTPAGSRSWKPEVSTKVYDFTTMALERGAAGRVNVTLDQVASLDRAGTLQILRSPRERELVFDVVAQPGGSEGPQWRISDPPFGTAISLSDLARGYRPYETYFLSRRANKLVPDGRLLPVVGPSLPTALTELVLAGPSKWLAPAVRSGAPAGLSLALGAVPVDNGVAVVDLARSALAVGPATRRELAAQLTWTLTQLPQVSAIRITVESEPYDIPGTPDLLDRASWRSVGPDSSVAAAPGPPPYFTVLGSAGQTVLSRVTRSERTTATLPLPAGTPAVGGLAVSLDESRIAAVAGDGQTLWLLPHPAQVGRVREIPGRSIAGVSFDVDGALWFTDRNRLWRVVGDGPPRAVPIANRPTGSLTGVSLARDGARVALVVDGEVFLAAISEEGREGHPAGLHLVAPRPAAFAASGVSSVAWRDASGPELLGRIDAGPEQVLHLTLADGNAAPGGAPERPRQLTAAPSVPTLVVGSENELFTGVGMQWRGTGAANAAAYPG